MNIRHSKIKILLVLFLVLFNSIANSKELGEFTPTAVSISVPPEYRWISYVSTGPADTSILDDSPDGVRGMFYRLVFISSGDAFIRTTMRIDEIVYQDAGCCWTIQKSWDIDFNKLEKSGVLMPPSYCSSIDSVVWLDTSVVKITYGDSECNISDLGKTKILANCELKEPRPWCKPVKKNNP